MWIGNGDCSKARDKTGKFKDLTANLKADKETVNQRLKSIGAKDVRFLENQSYKQLKTLMEDLK